MLILRRPWDGQPHAGASARADVGLLGLWVPQSSNMAGSGSIATPQTGIAIPYTAGLHGMQWSNYSFTANSCVSLFADSSASGLPTNTITMIVIGCELTANNAGIGVDSSTLGERCGVSLSGTAGVDFDFGGATSGTTRLRVTGLTGINQYDCWAFTAGPRGMEVWRNGVLVGSNAANPTRTATTAAWGLGLNGTAWTAAARQPFRYSLAAVSKQQLPSGLLAKLTSPPAVYAELFEPRSIPVPVSAAGGATTHAATGTLAGDGATTAGTAAHIAKHAATGALAGAGAAAVGSAARTRAHAGSGALAGVGGAVAGSAAHVAVHGATGALAGAGAEVVGSAARAGAATNHAATGTLEGAGAAVAGTAAHVAVHASTGALAGAGAETAGAAARVAAAVTHAATGALAGSGAALSASAQNGLSTLVRYFDVLSGRILILQQLS